MAGGMTRYYCKKGKRWVAFEYGFANFALAYFVWRKCDKENNTLTIDRIICFTHLLYSMGAKTKGAYLFQEAALGYSSHQP